MAIFGINSLDFWGVICLGKLIVGTQVDVVILPQQVYLLDCLTT